MYLNKISAIEMFQTRFWKKISDKIIKKNVHVTIIAILNSCKYFVKWV